MHDDDPLAELIRKLPETIRKALLSHDLYLHVALPAKVLTYDRATQTCKVQPSVRSLVPKGEDGWEQEDLPILQNVPVGWMRGGGASIQLELVQGDHVLLVFNESDISNWRQTGDTSDVSDHARHDLSYPYAIPCAAPDSQPLRSVEHPHIEVPAGKVITVGEDPDDCDFVAMAEKVLDELERVKSDLSTLKTATSVGLNASLPGDGTATSATFDSSTSAVPSNPSSVAGSKLKAEN